MKGKLFLTAAIICAALTFGISSTSSAAERSSNFATMQVEPQLLSNRSRRVAPVPPPPPPRHRYDRDRYDDYRRTNYRNSRRYSKPRTSVRRVNINISVTRRV